MIERMVEIEYPLDHNEDERNDDNKVQLVEVILNFNERWTLLPEFDLIFLVLFHFAFLADRPR